MATKEKQKDAEMSNIGPPRNLYVVWLQTSKPLSCGRRYPKITISYDG
jgi:hypothetical protein